MRHVLPVLLAAVILGAAAWIDLPRALGAHPWWSQQVVWIGVPLGLLFGGLLGLLPILPRQKLISSVSLTLVALANALFGKAQFAASFAEDALAGQMWYFGWIGTVIGSGVVLVLSLQVAAPRLRRLLWRAQA